MERIRSRIAHTLGGAWRVRGSGLLASACAALLLVGVGCTGQRALRMKDFLPAGWVPSQPAVQIVPAFTPQIQHLPDPTQEGILRPGIVGQMFILDASGSYTDVNGDLYVMAEDTTPRESGQPPQVMEVYHFDSHALRKMRTSDERLGECYALFLPYPENWKDVTQIRISTQYKPKGDPTKEPTLSGPPQPLILDFTPPGSQPDLWLKKDGSKPTAPVAMRGMPNVARDIARGGLTAPLSGPQTNYAGVPGGGVPPNYATAPAGGVPPAGTGPVMPATGSSGPLPPAGMAPLASPPGAAPPPMSNLSTLPPQMSFTPDRPQASVSGPNGEKLNVTAMALPPGQSMPNGWQRQNDGSIQPVGANTPANPGLVPQQQQWQQQPQQQGSYTPPPNYVPASAKYQSASEKYQSQPRIQHGAFNQPQAQTGQPGSLPALPASAMQGNRQQPPMQGAPAGYAPQVLTTPGGVSGPAVPTPPQPAPGFDPNSSVGAWANQPPPAPPAPPPGVSGTPTIPTVPPLPPLPSNPDGPLMPVIR